VSRILVIEADPSSRLIMRSRLNEYEHSVTLAETGARGLALARTSPFDLILVAMDLAGGVTGPEVCRRLKGVPELSAIPLVIYTNAPSSQESCTSAYDMGCEAFVTKAQMPHLDRIIAVMLRMKSRSDELAEQKRLLEIEHKQTLEAEQRSADTAISLEREGHASLLLRELAAGRPDGVLVVDSEGFIRQSDLGACELLGTQIDNKNLGSVAPAAGLEAFVRDARTTPREGFRFDISSRNGRAGRSIIASAIPVPVGNAVGMRLVLLLDAGKRRVAEELLTSHEPIIPRQQLGDLLEAAHVAYRPGAIVGASDSANRLRGKIVSLADRRVPVLLRTPIGGEKDLVAHVLHYTSRATGPLMTLHCNARTAEGLEQELFGYAKGASPGCVADKPGLLLLARDGTLYLDEVDCLPRNIQEALVQALRTGTITRAGSRRPEPIRTRLVASISQRSGRSSGLIDELAAFFREGLVDIPPMTERLEDIAAMATALLESCTEGGRQLEFSPEAAWLLGHHDWPGNYDELKDALQRTCDRATGPTIEVDDFPPAFQAILSDLRKLDLIPSQPGPGPKSLPGLAVSPPAAYIESAYALAGPGGAISPDWVITEEDPIDLDHYEKKALLRALDSCSGDRLAAAKLLRVGKSTIYRKLKRHGIK
jgi:DNA-binding NtrC family response regulator